MPSVVQEWVGELTFKQQTILFAAIRGCDGRNREDPSKSLARKFRSVVLKDADATSTFMKRDTINIPAFLKNLDPYPMHWLLHFTHACEIVGYKHPDHEVQLFFKHLYYDICQAMHVYPESEAQLDERLQDKVGRGNVVEMDAYNES